MQSVGQRKRVAGLDSIRAICALWVVMGHIGAPPLTNGLDVSNPFAKVVAGIYGNLWNGPAAVIIFFVISGFCIHYPYALSLQIPSNQSYLARRILRIGIPLVVAVGIARILKVNFSLFNDSILWSLVAEVVYYVLYPGLLAARQRIKSWVPLILISVGMALAVAASQPSAGNYPSFGNGLNWILGLPCWLSGCWLGERAAREEMPRCPSPRSLWMWRLSIWGLATACSILRFHSPMGYPWTLNIFAVVVVFWLAEEVSAHLSFPPPRWLEWTGTWSYSVYLFHLLALPIYKSLGVPNYGPSFNWMFMMSFVALSSYIFYGLVEYPSHILARAVARFLPVVNVPHVK